MSPQWAGAMAWILLAETQPLAAHHGFAAHTDERVTVRATITEYRFVNPHVQLYFDIESAARELEQAKRIQKFGPIAAR